MAHNKIVYLSLNLKLRIRYSSNNREKTIISILTVEDVLFCFAITGQLISNVSNTSIW